MIDWIHIIAGIGIIIINCIPFILRKSRLLTLTALISLMISLALIFFK